MADTMTSTVTTSVRYVTRSGDNCVDESNVDVDLPKTFLSKGTTYFFCLISLGAGNLALMIKHRRNLQQLLGFEPRIYFLLFEGVIDIRTFKVGLDLKYYNLEPENTDKKHLG